MSKKILIIKILLLFVLTIAIIMLFIYSTQNLNAQHIEKLRSGSSVFIGPGPTYEDGCDCTFWDNECFCGGLPK